MVARAATLKPRSFNTQPPEGGWLGFKHIGHSDLRFQHTAARRRLGLMCLSSEGKQGFQHTAARRRLGMCKEMFV